MSKNEIHGTRTMIIKQGGADNEIQGNYYEQLFAWERVRN